MKRPVLTSVLVALALLGLIASFASARSHQPNPKDLFAWAQLGGRMDWSDKAAAGDQEAQFFVGLSLLRAHLQKMVDRVPYLSAIPVIGKRYFEKTSYGFDSTVTQEQLAQAYQWIKKSADQGYAPAREAEKLFAGRLKLPGPPRPE